jgi:phage baseplate assembly protein W
VIVTVKEIKMGTSKVKYSDIGLKGNPIVNVDSVLQGIRNILHTRVGERMFNRRFGSRIEDYLFEPFTFVTSRLILGEILSSITRNDDRVEVIAKETKVNMNPDKRQYEVVIALRIKGLEGIYIYDENLIPHSN